MTAVCLLLVGSWTYAGFADDPPAPARAEVASLRCVCGGEACPCRSAADCKRPCFDVATTERRPTAEIDAGPQVQVRAPTPSPRLYRLADVTGKVWRHTDPAWLKQWVAQVNARVRLADPTERTPFRLDAYGGASCPTGGCR